MEVTTASRLHRTKQQICHRERTDRELLEACAILDGQGVTVSIPKLSAMTGEVLGSLYSRVRRLTTAGRFPYHLSSLGLPKMSHRGRTAPAPAREDLSDLDQTLLAKAAEMAGPDGSVSITEVYRALGLDPIQTKRANVLKIWGYWTWPNLSRTPGQPTKAEMEEIELRKVEERTAAYAGMLNGRAEIDEPPNGMPTRSGKDHAVEGRRKFRNVAGSPRVNCINPSRTARSDQRG